MNICFRPCTVEDLPTLCSFSRKLFFEAFRDTCSPEDMDAFLERTYNADRIRGELEDPDTAFWFLYLDDAPVGYIKVNECPALIYPPICDYLLNSDDYDPNKDD